MSQSQETSQRLTGGEREQQLCQSPAEYIYFTADPREQRARSQEVIDVADKMLARNEDGSFTGQIDATYLDTNHKQHLSFILDYRGRDEGIVALTDGTLEEAIDEVLEPATDESREPYTFYRQFMQSKTTPENVTAKRVLRCKVAAEVIKATLDTD